MSRLRQQSLVWVLALAAALLLTACPPDGGTDPPPPPPPPGDGDSSVQPCEDSQPWAAGFQANACQMADGSAPPVTPVYWPDVCVPGGFGWAPVQGSFDQLSWRSFFYDSWPAKADGEPDDSKALGVPVDGVFEPVVWERYKNAEDLYAAGGDSLNADDYSAPSPVPDGCDPDGPRVLSMTSKVPHGSIEAVRAALGEGDETLQSIDQAFRGPLYPQGPEPLLPVFYEIRINEIEFVAIVSAGAQNKSPDELNCTGEYDVPDCTPFSFPLESTEVKAAWKRLSQDEIDSGTFFYQDLQVQDPESGECSVEPMGLVGLHIARKVSHAVVPQGARKNSWAWATFEHAGNVPPLDGDDSGSYSFYNSECTPQVDAQTCAAVQTPDPDEQYQCCENLYRYAAGTVPANPTPDQVTRIDPSPEQTQECNAVYAEVDKGVFDNYFLVATQWPKSSDGSAPPTVTPTFSRNTVIETYFTKWVDDQQVNTSSCMSCHSGSQAVDMSYLFLNNS